MQPILGWLIKNKIEHSYISSGLKITTINIKGMHLRFIDSINFTLCGLSKFPGTFEFKGNKGYFPHYFKLKIIKAIKVFILIKNITDMML